MAVIRMDVLAEVYALYGFTTYEQEKGAVLDDGIEKVLLRLKRYTRNPDKFDSKSAQAMRELEAVLERFYYQDGRFSKAIYSKAKSYISDLSDRLLQRNDRR